jgi:DNA-binding MarR family transcriptional regulator
VNSESRHQLELLEALSENAETTQRRLSTKVGIALGLTNMYLKRLVRKGYVKCVNVSSNRLVYLVTPAGIAEKTRLTYEFMEYSVRLYRDARARVRDVLAPVAGPNVRVAIYGSGEAAELTYLCLAELGIRPVTVFSDTDDPMPFNLPARPIAQHAMVQFDLLIVASFENPSPMFQVLERVGVDRSRLLPLRELRQ